MKKKVLATSSLFIFLLIVGLMFYVFSRPAIAKRAFPGTNYGVHVFNDQLDQGMSNEQVKFAATHYAGCQKMLRSETQRLRKYNSNFVVLHYRLGEGLGYRANGEWIYVINGNDWVREWPETTKPEWFYKYNGSNVFFNPYGWYLMELGNANWRTFWTTQVKQQMQNNQNDGLFADSLSVPNYFGGENFTPNLPGYDVDFEKEWSAKIENFIRYVKNSFEGKYYFIANVGFWVTSRETTNYNLGDGVMVEGFGAWDAYSPFELSDWQLQMNHILNAEKNNKVVIAQSYLDSPAQIKARMFFLSNYLLIKSKRTYINIDMGYEPEWFPEYNVKIGSPVNDIPQTITSLRLSSGVYRRKYSKGIVLTNPTASKKILNFSRYYYQVIPSGGGFVRSDGKPRGRLTYKKINKISLAPFSGAILLTSLN